MSPCLFRHGWYEKARHVASPFFNERPDTPITVLVIHNISLPARQFGTPYVDALFTGKLDCHAHESFADLRGVEVSAHFFINRQGELTQYVAVDKRAWHAGLSRFDGRDNVNDFSIGIELEGTDDIPYTDSQYQTLCELTLELMRHYPVTPDRIVGHSDVAPGRKTDPGGSFDWQRFLQLLKE
jgi:AmpD protein